MKKENSVNTEKIEQNVEQVVESEKTEKKADSSVFLKEAISTGAKLKKQKQVLLTVPISELNQGDDYVVVAINGYKYKIKRGEEVEVPYAVYKLLKEAKYI